MLRCTLYDGRILTMFMVGMARCAVRCPALSRPPPARPPEPLANGKTAPAGTSQRDVPTIQGRCPDAPNMTSVIYQSSRFLLGFAIILNRSGTLVRGSANSLGCGPLMNGVVKKLKPKSSVQN